MQIRRMTEGDIPAIIHLGSRMHEESVYSILTTSPEKIASLCSQILVSLNMLALVVEEDNSIIGMIGGTVYEYEYGEGLIAIDRLVYVSPGYRGSRAFLLMVKGYVAWAKEQGASIIFLNQTTGINQEAVASMYTHIGFQPVGGIFAMIGA